MAPTVIDQRIDESSTAAAGVAAAPPADCVKILEAIVSATTPVAATASTTATRPQQHGPSVRRLADFITEDVKKELEEANRRERVVEERFIEAMQPVATSGFVIIVKGESDFAIAVRVAEGANEGHTCAVINYDVDELVQTLAHLNTTAAADLVEFYFPQRQTVAKL